MTQDTDYVKTRQQVQIGSYNGSAKIIAAVPDLTQGGEPHYVVTAVTYHQDKQGEREYITWGVRTDQPGYYWGRYFLVSDTDDPKVIRATALTDMIARAAIPARGGI